ncbi:MAG: hypothetical protein LBD68_07030 [Zoogloeaceae bacterium]|jgi:hypothetical protein|nr:hypothetical protein [Zoogloeaceae bacterium]
MKGWTNDPERFTMNSIQKMPGQEQERTDKTLFVPPDESSVDPFKENP